MNSVFNDFIECTANHSMEILLDNGDYRHLKLTANGSAIYRFDLITWPGHLCISGDCGTYTFSRLKDMFEFFRSDKPFSENSINAGYWGEKLLSICPQGKYREFSIKLFKKAIAEHIADWEFSSKQEKSEVWEDVRWRVFRHAEDNDYRAYDAAYNYKSDHGHQFIDLFESNMEEYTCHYLWCLYAIVWGIKQYDENNVSKSS